MRKPEVYSSKNVVSLVVVFFVLFWLLYSIGSFLHESKKINDEIAKIEETNQKLASEIVVKRAEIEYLKTPQRIEKEAKMQMNKRREGEQVLVFIEEKLNILPTERKRQARAQVQQLAHWQKWQWVFLGRK